LNYKYLLHIVLFSSFITYSQIEPSLWWNFESVKNNKVLEVINGIEDSISGYFSLVKGVSDSSLKLDGYTTKLTRDKTKVPEFTGEITIESWIALQTLPWNWSGIVSQGGKIFTHVPFELPLSDINNLEPGLVGVQYGNPDLTDPLGKEVLLSTENDWTGSMINWSNRWRGFIWAPFTGEVSFRAEADDGMQLSIADDMVIDGWKKDGARIGKILMNKGELYPVTITYTNDGGKAFLRLYWSWQDVPEHLVPLEALGYGAKEDFLARCDIIPPEPPTPIYDQKIFFGIGPQGQLGFFLNIDDKEYQCITEQKLPLLKWNHVSAVYDQIDGMRIFLNGELADQLNISGNITPKGGSDLLVGMNIQKLGPVGSERKASADIHSPMIIDGLLDELKIYNKALPADVIKKNFESAKQQNMQPLKWRKMPSGPENLKKDFSAFYTRLRYDELWETKWRVSEDPDILVHFDKLPVRFIFWRGTSYGGAWITENGIWMGDQSLERSNEGKSPMGCSEHMSDKQTRYSSVRIVEKNDARIVIQWRYAVSDILYDIFGTNSGSGWGEWADEYYYIYPNGVSTRHQTLWSNFLSHEWQETIVLNQPGTSPEDNINIDAMTLGNMEGKFKTYEWKNSPPESFSEPENINIQMVNLKSKYKPFIIFEPNPKIKPFKGSVRQEYSKFPWWNHWPVAQLPNDGRKAFGPDRPSHSSLSQSIEQSDVINDNGDGSYTVVTLIGMTDKKFEKLAPLARSWNNPALLKIKSNGFTNAGYSKKERAYIIIKDSLNSSGLKIELSGSADSPIINPSFVIKNWVVGNVQLEINGKKIPRGDSFRYGFRETMEGSDLITWIEIEEDISVEIMFRPE
jgi:hypothetical protein